MKSKTQVWDSLASGLRAARHRSMEIRCAMLTVWGYASRVQNQALPVFCSRRACNPWCGCGSGSGGGAGARAHKPPGSAVTADKSLFPHRAALPQKTVEAPREGAEKRGLQAFNATEPFRTPSWPTKAHVCFFNIAGASRRADLPNPSRPMSGATHTTRF